MNKPFMDLLDKGVVVFLDDILIYSTNMEENFEYLAKLFTCSCKHAFYFKLKKCSFLCKTTTLIFDITLEGMHISDAKVQYLKE